MTRWTRSTGHHRIAAPWTDELGALRNGQAWVSMQVSAGLGYTSPICAGATITAARAVIN